MARGQLFRLLILLLLSHYWSIAILLIHSWQSAVITLNLRWKNSAFFYCTKIVHLFTEWIQLLSHFHIWSLIFLELILKLLIVSIAKSARWVNIVLWRVLIAIEIRRILLNFQIICLIMMVDFLLIACIQWRVH